MVKRANYNFRHDNNRIVYKRLSLSKFGQLLARHEHGAQWDIKGRVILNTKVEKTIRCIDFQQPSTVLLGWGRCFCVLFTLSPHLIILFPWWLLKFPIVIQGQIESTCTQFRTMEMIFRKRFKKIGDVFRNDMPRILNRPSLNQMHQGIATCIGV